MEDLRKSWVKLASAFEELERVIEGAQSQILEAKAQQRELEGILKSIVDNNGEMTPMQIVAVTNYYGWEIQCCPLHYFV